MDLSAVVIQLLPIFAMGSICVSAYASIWSISKVIHLVRQEGGYPPPVPKHYPRRKRKYDNWRDKKYGYGTKFLY